MWWCRFLAITLLISGCGYTLSHRLKNSFLDKRGVFVPTFKNRTAELGVERLFTNALIRELESRHEITIRSAESDGLELRGEVSNITYGPTASTAYGFGGLAGFKRTPSEYGVRVDISLTLLDPSTGKTLWSNSFGGFRRVNVDTSRTYDFQSPSSVGLSTEYLVQSVFSDIARDVMRDVYDDMLEIL